MLSVIHLIIISSTALFILNGCTTVLQVAAKNQTSIPQTLSVLVAEDPQKHPVKKFETEVDANSSITPVVVGDFKPGALVTLKMSLRTGGVTKQTKFTLSSKPDPYLASIESIRINAPAAELSDASAVERQIADISGSYPPPTGDIGAFLLQHLGGLYTRERTSANEIMMRRQIDPQELASAVGLQEFMPAIAPPPEFALSLITDSSNVGIVQAQLPKIFDLKISLSTSEVNQHVFTMKNTAWRMTPHAWYTIERQLQTTPKGKEIYTKILNLLISHQELFYLDSAFVLGDVELNNYSAESIEAEADVTFPPVFTHAGGAYKWAKDSTHRKTYKNIVLRVNYESLRPALVQPAPKEWFQATQNPRNEGSQKLFIKPVFHMNPNRSEPTDASVFLQDANGDIQNVSIISSRAERFDPKFKLMYYEIP